MMSTYSQRQQGMTLIEMLVVIGIYSVLLLAVITTTTSLYRYNAFAIEQTTEINNARRGMTEWNRDLKEMTVGENGAYPLVITEPHRVGYYSDTDRDDAVEYVEYVLASTTLTKYTYQPQATPPLYNTAVPDRVEILSEFVQNTEQATSTFLYYDNTGQLLPTGDPVLGVRLIRAQVIVNVNPVRNPGSFTLRSSVAPRNLKDNL